jgi:hypothetical protein
MTDRDPDRETSSAAGETLVTVCLGRRTALNTLGHMLEALEARGIDPARAGLLIVSSERLYGQNVVDRVPGGVSPGDCPKRSRAPLARRSAWTVPSGGRAPSPLTGIAERFADCRIVIPEFGVAEYRDPQNTQGAPRGVADRFDRRRRVGRAVRTIIDDTLNGLDDFIGRYTHRRVQVLTGGDAAWRVCRWMRRRYPGVTCAWVDDGLKQHAVVSCRERIDRALRKLARLLSPVTGFAPAPKRPELTLRFDEYWVYGERRRRDLARLGIDSARVVTFGFPRAAGMDVSAPPETVIPEARAEQKVCVAMQCLSLHGLCAIETEEAIYRDIASALIELGFGRVTMKLHPENDAARYREVFGQVRKDYTIDADRLTVIDDEPLESVLARSHAMVTLFSTAALEALLQGRLLVVIDLPWLGMPLGLEDVSTTVRSVDEMRRELSSETWHREARRRLESGWNRFVRDEIGPV